MRGILRARTRQPAAARLAAAAALLTTALTGAVTLGPAAPASAATPAMVSAGDGFSCALTGQEVWCWGRNTTGQLGDGTGTDSLVPVRVGTLPVAIGVAAGHDHTCAVDAGNSVWCWGNNAFGEVGNGTTSTAVNTPVQVPGLLATQVSAGDGSTCALTVAQTVECWGDNNYGELGDGTTADASTPQPVTGLPPITQIAVGYFHACALDVTGAVWCWGDNSGGALGTGKKNGTSDVPVAARLSGAISIAAGSADTCAILTGGDLKCWGGNSVGQLGTGDTVNHPAPVQVFGVTSGAQQVTLGQGFGCAIISTAVPTAFCWGDSGGDGELGTGSFSLQSPVPVPVFGLTSSPTGLATGPAQLAAGTNHACVAMQTGEVECWGQGNYGNLGDGSTADRAIPTVTIGMDNQNVYSVSAGTSTGCAITAFGGLNLSCWGEDAGDGSPVSTVHTSAVAVAGLPGRRRFPGFGRVRRLRGLPAGRPEHRGGLLGRQQQGRAGQQHDDRRHLGGEGEEAERRPGSHDQRPARVRARAPGRGPVLGFQQQRPAGRRHHDRPAHAGAGDRPAGQGGSGRGGRQAHLRAADRRHRVVLGQGRERRARQRFDERQLGPGRGHGPAPGRADRHRRHPDQRELQLRAHYRGRRLLLGLERLRSAGQRHHHRQRRPGRGDRPRQQRAGDRRRRQHGVRRHHRRDGQLLG